MRVTILDGYIDEPSRLGVPPFISPYPRYAAGAVADAGHEPEYMTIDHWRAGRRPSGDLLFIISGALVPGKYLRSMPMSERELAAACDGAEVETHVWFPTEPKTYRSPTAKHACNCDPDAYLFDLLESGSARPRRRESEEWERWPVQGAGIIARHQDFPQPLIAEMDMSHGCPHFVTGGCSFCTEPLFGMPAYRNEGDIIAEMKALLNAGCTNFRLGGQSCIFSYKAMGVGEVDRPKPNVKALGGLFDSIAKLRGIKVLHTDNADPAAIAAHPDESARILEMIVSTCTSGNILSMGIESADPLVAEKNNLNSTAAEALAAIRLVNKAGSEVGPTGLPKLLPGLNFLGGLDFETPETFELNKRFLCEVLDSGLMLRRINIRQVSPVRRDFGRHNNKKEFIRFKEFVRGNIDSRMLERVAPAGRVLRAVYTEVPIGKLMFARQIGTYPILIGIPQDIMPGTFLDVMIAAHGSRSLTGLEYPLDINSCQLSALGAIPGIGRKRAIRLFKARPLQSPDAIRSALDDPALAAGVAKHAGL